MPGGSIPTTIIVELFFTTPTIAITMKARSIIYPNKGGISIYIIYIIYINFFLY